MSDANSGQDYTGADNLETMKLARNYNAFLLGLIRRVCPPSGSILDFGAGAGTYAHLVKETSPSILCVEPDRNLASNLLQEGFIVFQDIKSVPANSVEALYSLNVLEHIEDDACAIAELYRCLKPGGRGLIYVPAMQILFSAMDKKVCHFRRYERGDLVFLMEQAGFKVEHSAYADSLGFFASLAYKWWGNNDGGINEKSLIIYDRLIFPISRICDVFFQRWFGKNTFVIIQKPES
jgi:SAM-dependent methyltransferase